MRLGNGIDPLTAYDANGNIKSMWQKGLALNESIIIDDLVYYYAANSNKLIRVTDLSFTNNKLGDFKDGFIGTVDYGYDYNGNLITDRNKAIWGPVGINKTNGGIQYNHLNLPNSVSVVTDVDNPTTVKGSVAYLYDAGGNKLKKITTENPVTANGNKTITTTTSYIGGYIYESKTTVPSDAAIPDYTDRLQFLPHEEGRIRFKPATTLPASFQYDYMLKDHLGNVRMVLTEEQQQDKYPVASLEDAKLNTVEKNYYAIQDAQVANKSEAIGITDYVNDNGIGNNPTDAAFSATNSAKLYKLNSNTAKTGLGITLKVMAGDKIDVFGKSYYFQNNTGGSAANIQIPILDILGGLMGGPTGGTAAGAHGGVTATQLNGYPGTTTGIGSLLTQQTNDNNGTPQKPKAYINYMFFDEQFKYVNGGISPVGNNSELKNHFAELQNLAVTKNGYVYIYCSNESPVNVFFDNLQVVQSRSPILEETHYYPFGLTMAGISSKAAGGIENKKGYNGNELQNKEFSDGSGLELYDFNARTYDQQTGRFIQIDPLSEDGQESFNPYHFSYNNPIRFNDPDGEAPDDIIIRGKNNSSITIKTDLIDISVNAGSIVGDLGGNYTLQGNDILVAALDIVGIVDPTGVADVAAAILEAKAGNWGGAILSSFGVVPLLGDLGKIGKVGKHVKTIEKAIDGAKAKNLKEAAEKGIPNTQLGPSGKPKIHTASKSNLKEAKDAARNNPKSNTSPEKNTKDKGQKTHYHSTKDGEKMKGKDNIHYENRSSKRNPN